MRGLLEQSLARSGAEDAVCRGGQVAACQSAADFCLGLVHEVVKCVRLRSLEGDVDVAIPDVDNGVVIGGQFDLGFVPVEVDEELLGGTTGPLEGICLALGHLNNERSVTSLVARSWKIQAMLPLCGCRKLRSGGGHVHQTVQEKAWCAAKATAVSCQRAPEICSAASVTR